MRRECDLAEGGDDLDGMPEDNLPFGEWMRASPMKKASVSMEEQRRPVVNPLRRQLFKKFKKDIYMNKSKREGGVLTRGLGKDTRAWDENVEKERVRVSPLSEHSGAKQTSETFD
ncbi:hypothetical protein ACS0TY_032815 [Phlomoides rotata]